MSEELHGVWSTPDVPDLRIPGTLTRLDQGWRLTTVGTLMVDSGGWDGLYLVEPRTLWGACHGVSITLMGCFVEAVHDLGSTMTQDAAGQWTMTWQVDRLIRGGAVTETTPFTAAEFEITGLPAWWPVSGLQGPHVREGAYVPPDDVSIPLDDGMIAIGVRATRTRGRRESSLRERVVVRVERASGFTLDELEREITGPMRALVAIGVDKPVSVFNMRLEPAASLTVDGQQRTLVVDPRDGQEPDPGPYTPFPLAPSLESMSSFIPAWLTVARRCSVPLDAVEPGRRSGSLQLQLLDIVNAAETLHRALHDEPREHPFADRVRQTLKDAGGFNGDERRDVRYAVRLFMGLTLEDRLLALAEELGPDVCMWLFRGGVRPWAFVTARIRNVLSHGFEASDGVHEDHGALLGALRLTESVVTLRLLTEAGLPSDTHLTTQLGHHSGMRALAHQRIADWVALAHRISPQQWPARGRPEDGSAPSM